MPYIHSAAKSGHGMVNGICRDPSHSMGLEHSIEELESRCTCKEAKVLELRADGSRYTIHASSATIRGGGDKKPVRASKELDPTPAPYAPVSPSEFRLAFPVLDAAVRSGALNRVVGNEVAPDQLFTLPPKVKAGFATNASVDDNAKVDYQITRAMFKPDHFPSADSKAKIEEQAAADSFLPATPPTKSVDISKLSDEAVKSYVMPYFTAPWSIEARCKESHSTTSIKPIKVKDQVREVTSPSSKKEQSGKDDEEWVDVGKERKKEKVEEEMWVLV